MRVSLLCAACLALPGAQAEAAISLSGVVFTLPGNFSIGPGDTVLPDDQRIHIGQQAPGQIDVTAGSHLRSGLIILGGSNSGLATGNGVMNLSGSGTLLELSGILNDRLDIGSHGLGVVNLTDGARIDGTVSPANCGTNNNWCQTFVGMFAGSDGTFNLSGAGTQAQFLKTFVVAHGGSNGQGFATPGANTTGRVNITSGALLETQAVDLARDPQGPDLLGTETTRALVNLSGPGSMWVIKPNTIDGSGAELNSAEGGRAWATVNVSAGAKMRVEGKAGTLNGLFLSSGGRTDYAISGTGSTLEWVGDGSVLGVGIEGGTASFVASAGAVVKGVWYTVVGRNGAIGTMTLDGAGTLVSATGAATPAAAGSFGNVIAPSSPQNATLDIGRNGHGTVNVLNGSRLEVSAVQGAANGPTISLGRGEASSGTLSINGTGSVVNVSALSLLAEGGAGEAFNPLVRVGREGSGFLTVSAGGLLWLDGQAVSTAANARGTVLIVGGVNDTSNGGTGIATVTGAGSEIRLTGSDTFIGVGQGPQSNGQLTIQDSGLVSATNLSVGRSGGVGVLRLDGGTLNLSGQQTGANLSGASLVIGSGGGTGIATVDHGSRITVTNMGSEGASLSLGGSGNFPSGDGTLTLTGGSQIKVVASSKNAVVNVGRDGSALMRVRGASSLDVGDGSIYVGRLSGSDGTLLVSEGSSIAAGWVGVGRNRVNGTDVDGGTATMVLNNSTLTAAQIIIGTNGFLGGNGTIIGNVVNHGIFSPGNSPGTMVIDGAYTAASGNRLIMEVLDNGQGGFNTDLVLFGNGSTLDLAALNVEFRFLGSTDPNAFNASGGFDVDTFFRTQMQDGSQTDLSHSLFTTASFSAVADSYVINNFSFTADGGASFTAAPVPEPQTWLMLMAGLVLLTRRRRAPALQMTLN